MKDPAAKLARSEVIVKGKRNRMVGVERRFAASDLRSARKVRRGCIGRRRFSQVWKYPGLVNLLIVERYVLINNFVSQRS